MNCVVCESNLVEIFDIIDQKRFLECKLCLAKFLDKANLLKSNRRENPLFNTSK